MWPFYGKSTLQACVDDVQQKLQMTQTEVSDDWKFSFDWKWIKPVNQLEVIDGLYLLRLPRILKSKLDYRNTFFLASTYRCSFSVHKWRTSTTGWLFVISQHTDRKCYSWLIVNWVWVVRTSPWTQTECKFDNNKFTFKHSKIITVEIILTNEPFFIISHLCDKSCLTWLCRIV